MSTPDCLKITVMHVGEPVQATIVGHLTGIPHYRLKPEFRRKFDQGQPIDRPLYPFAEGREWARGWDEETAAALRAANTLADGEDVTKQADIPLFFAYSGQNGNAT